MKRFVVRFFSILLIAALAVIMLPGLAREAKAVSHKIYFFYDYGSNVKYLDSNGNWSIIYGTDLTYTPGQPFTMKLKIDDGYAIQKNMIGIRQWDGSKEAPASEITYSPNRFVLTGEVTITVSGAQTAQWIDPGNGIKFLVLSAAKKTRDVIIKTDMSVTNYYGDAIPNTYDSASKLYVYQDVLVNDDASHSWTFSPRSGKEDMHLRISDIETYFGPERTYSGSEWYFTEDEQRLTIKGNAFNYYNSGPITITAKGSWPVTFDANGGSGSMNTQYVLDGGSLTLPANTFSPPSGKGRPADGKDWEWKFTYGSYWYPAGYKLTNVTKPYALKANWAAPCTVTLKTSTYGYYTATVYEGYTLQGATVKSGTVTHGEFDTFVPKLQFKVFDGWYKDAALTTPWDTENDRITGDTTIYAKWLPPVFKSVKNVVGGVKLMWDAVTDGDSRGYTIWRKEGSGSFEKINSYVSGTHEYTDTTVVSGKTYTYRLGIASDGLKENELDQIGKTITYIAAPPLKSAENVNGGVKVTWGKPAGAANFRVYRKTSDSNWGKVGETTATDYTDKTAKSGTKYSYTVRCITADGSATTSAYNTTGKSVTYIAAPTLKKAENVFGGVKVTWEKPAGAVNFRVYRKTSGTNWGKVGETTATNYTDKTAKSGTKYTYTVRCITANGSATTSAYNTTGKTVTYIAAPTLKKAENVFGGIKVTWEKPAGAVKFRIYRKTSGGSWGKVGETTATNYTDKTAKSGTKYSYTVRCITANGSATTSAYDTTGKSVTYIAAPTVKGAQNVSGGVKVTWEKPAGAVKFRVLRKTGSGSWGKIADTTATTYTDKTAKSGTTYSYTVRCITSAGAYVSGYDPNGVSVKAK